ncbi:hypothetical protein [Phenylobacterium sp.]|jgi:hypothetical protein|uniref:hypothetical protein n=1 Tax=Phenylobacterium sp. TaxID=1871053 RepID=UPI002F424B1F
MAFISDRRNLSLLIGAGLALLAGVAIAALLVLRHRNETPPPAPASQAGLVIDATGKEEGKLDPAKPLRCFVGGQFVGELTLADCAQRNGVATGALDVGVDESGQLAAADQAGTVLTPLPPAGAATAPAPAAAAPAASATPASTSSGTPTPAGACWRYADGEWRRLPQDLTLNACVQTLFAGRCERPDGATYGRWMQQTLRLAPGKVEVSGDNHSFRLLVEQAAGCAIPAIG